MSFCQFMRRKGVADTSGQQYEWKLAALLFLRSCMSGNKFFLATNMDAAGAFDDLVLIYSLEGRCKACFLQLKHKHNPEYVVPSSALVQPSGSFSLPVLCHSFNKVEQLLPLISEQLGVDIVPENVDVILYTNAVVKCSSRDSATDSFLNVGGQVSSFSEELDSDIFSSFEELIQYNSFLKELENLSKQTSHYKFFLQLIHNFCEINQTNRFLHKLNKLKVCEQFNDELLKLLREVKDCDNLLNFRVFLLQLKVFHKQMSEWDFTGIILKEFNKVFGVSYNENDAAFFTFMNKMQDWWETKSYYLTADAPFWRETVCDVLSENAIKELQELGVSFSEIALENLSEVLLTHKVLIVTSKTGGTPLHKLKVHQALGKRKHIVVGQDTIKNHCDWLLNVWSCQTEPVVLVVQDDLLDYKLIPARGNLVVIRTQCSNPDGHKNKIGMVEEVEDVCSLAQLDELSRNKVLNMQVVFQGYHMTLRTLVEKDTELLDAICGDNLMDVLRSDGSLSVGRKLQDVVNYLIPRTLQRLIHFPKSILKSYQPNTTFAISGVSLDDIKQLLPLTEEPCVFHKTTTGKFISCECQFYLLNDNNDLCEQVQSIFIGSGSKTVHWLHMENDSFRWMRSTGDVDFFYSHMNNARISQYNTQDVAEISEMVVLITAEPGMGKSTFLTCLAKTMKEIDKTIWVVRVNLNDCTDYLDRIERFDEESALNFIENAVTNSSSRTQFERTLFMHSFKKLGNIVLLFDGFDEISPRYTKKGIDLLNIVKNTQIVKMYTTSRPITSELLQANFLTLPFTLDYFNKHDQRCFLISFWKQSIPDCSRLHDFVNEFVLLINKCDLGHNGMRIPLQTMMLAECFQSDAEVYCNSNDMTALNLPNQLNLIELYQQFVEKKYEIAIKRTGISVTQTSYSNHAKMLGKIYTDTHMVLALRSLLSSESLKRLNAPEVQIETNKLLLPKDEVEKLGIIIKIENGIPHFIHQTFAEYFTALWFASFYFKCSTFLEKHLFDSGFSVVRNMFDRILANKLELHCAILNNEEEHVLKTLLTTAADVNVTDDGGRTALHLAVAYKGMYHSINIINTLVNSGAHVDIKDCVFSWNPIQYAERLRFWDVVETLLNANAEPKELVFTRNKLNDTNFVKSVLSICCKHGYLKLTEFLVNNDSDINMVVGNFHSSPLHLVSRLGHAHLANYLVNVKADINASNIDGSTPLHIAAARGHIDIVQCLVNAGADVNRLNIAGDTPLEVAEKKHHSEIVQWLLETGTVSDSLVCVTVSSLHQAAQDGNNSKLNGLIRGGIDVNVSDEEGRTPLHLSAFWNHLTFVATLIKAGANVNVTNNVGLTPLHQAARQGHTIVAVSLLNAGAVVNAPDHSGLTPLHQAARWGHSQTVTELLNAQALVNAVTDLGVTPLHGAARFGHTQIVDNLIQMGANVNVIDGIGVTPLYWACTFSHTTTVKKLLMFGAQANCVDIDGHSAFHRSITRGHIPTIVCLIEAGADIEKANSAGFSPLHLATIGRHMKVVSYLVKAGASVNTVNSEGSTPLHLSIETGHNRIMQCLVEAGADVNLANNSRSTPLSLAMKSDKPKIKQIMKSISGYALRP